MLVPSTRLFSAGELETGAYLNSAITNLGNFMLGKPIFQATQTVAQSIPNAFWQGITFTTETIDRDNGHNTSTNTDRYVVQTAGWYYISGMVTFTGNATGIRGCSVWNNGSQILASVFFTSSTLLAGVANPVMMCPVLVYCNVGDYLQLAGYQNSGGALNTIVGSGAVGVSTMTVIWVSS